MLEGKLKLKTDPFLFMSQFKALNRINNMSFDTLGGEERKGLRKVPKIPKVSHVI